MRTLKHLRVYDAAVQYSAAIGHFLASASIPVKDAEQVRSAAKSVSNNIAEAHGRGEGNDRRRVYKIARGEAEESLNQLRGLLDDQLIARPRFYGLFNRGRTIVKMLTELIGD